MQLTRFDRWLRKTFVYEMHLYSLRQPETVPRGIRVEALPETPGQNYRFKFIARSERAADELIRLFAEHGQLYATRVVDRKTWYARLLAPGRKSVTWWLVWLVLSIIGGALLLHVFHLIWDNPTVRKTLHEAWETLQG
ncbi:hypothetical protein HNR46_002598 [Haloferula luteola]|uniref:Uncharacterized protein n=1 Tax=Haloferula luteola TaxID=595692 RepID=A0A840V489_9BACT|nr:hypothetical protein [Haloferula luteola]MBB5352353.1 hypothetical protein [Haloferula luteola]